jgi:hypothetical protein
MNVNKRRTVKGFSLAEAMLAMLFISIGLFAYVSLHTRIIHSNFKLEARQLVKEKIATDIASKCAKARQGGTTTSGISEASLPPTTGGTNTTSGSGSSFPAYSPYSTNTGYADSQAMKDSNTSNSYPESQTYKNSKPADAPGVLEGGFTIAYDEGQKTTNPTGLPPNLSLVESTAKYVDRNGQHTYYVDCYERRSLLRW